MMRSTIILSMLMFTSCGSQQWRMGNQYDEMSVVKKREKERDRIMRRAQKIQKNTAKHYIKEHKSHDGKINLFKRDGFDWGF